MTRNAVPPLAPIRRQIDAAPHGIRPSHSIYPSALDGMIGSDTALRAKNKKPGVLSEHPGFWGSVVRYTKLSEILGWVGEGS